MDLKRDLDPKLTRSVFDLNIAKVQITPPPKKISSVHLSASLIDQLVKNSPIIQETPVQFLGQEDLLEKG